MMKARDPFTEPVLDLPPGFSPVPLREYGDAFAHGCAIASEAGAGTLVWVRRYDLIEFAVVLEPEEPLSSARRAFFAGMNATADAVAVHCPPERQIGIRWPDTILFDGGLLGGGRLGWPADCDQTEVPEWLVFGVILRAADMAHVGEFDAARGVALQNEGFETIDAEAIIGSFARHLMTAFDQWNESGFDPVGRDYLQRLTQDETGGRRGIDVNGDLLVALTSNAAPMRRSLLTGLAKAAWYDPAFRAPKLE